VQAVLVGTPGLLNKNQKLGAIANMSHDLIKNSFTGKYEIMTRGTAWHGLGQVVEDAQTWGETMEKAGLNWTVSKHQQKSVLTGELIDSYDIYRDDTKGFLGNVGADYNPIQNIEQFKFVDELLERENGAHYEAAGALGGGQRVFALANLSDAFEVVDGDRHENYLLFSNSHNGSQAARVFLTSVRVVCANTLRAALSESSSRAGKARKNGVDSDIIKIRHTKSAQARLGAAKNIIMTAHDSVKSLREKMQILAGKQMTKANYEAIVNRLFPIKVKDGQDAPAAASVTRRDNVLTEILNLYEGNDNNAFPEIRGTAYNYLNAITEYVDHYRPVVMTDAKAGWTVEQVRANNALFNGGAELKESALDIILAETMNNPSVSRSTKYAAGRDTNGAAVLNDILSKN